MPDRKRVLILCTGNSARSQMAEGLLRHDAGDRFTVESGGTKPSSLRPEAITVMEEVGIDISSHGSKHADEFGGQDFDYVLTVCDKAKESCPVYFGRATRLHRSFNDPAAVDGSEEKRLAAFRVVRDELRSYLKSFPPPKEPLREDRRRSGGHDRLPAEYARRPRLARRLPLIASAAIRGARLVRAGTCRCTLGPLTAPPGRQTGLDQNITRTRSL